MALIGAISITLSAQAEKFNSGIASAQKSLTGFAKTADRMTGGIGSYAANWGKAARDIGGGAAKGFGGYLKDWGLAAKEISSGPLSKLSAGFGGLTGGINRAVTGFTNFGASAVRSIGPVISKVGLLAAGMATAAGLGIYKLVRAGSDLVESQNKIKVVFGSSSKTIIDEANRMAATFGQNRNEFMDFAGQFGGLFKGAGFAAGDVANLSNQMVNLARDSASFFNVPIDVALDKLKSGLSGEARPLRDFGVFIDDATVQAQALAMGMVRVGGELSTNQKIQARLALITKGLSDAHGDYARTAQDVANKTREVSGRIQNLAADMGTALQPVAKSVLGEAATGVQALSMAWQENQKAIVSWAMGATGGIGETTKSMGILQKAVGFVADSFQVLTTVFKGLQFGATFMVNSIVSAFALMEKGINKVTGKKGAKGSNFFQVWEADLDRINKGQVADLKKQMAAPWASESINKAFASAARENQSFAAELKRTTLPVVNQIADTLAGGLASFAQKVIPLANEAANTLAGTLGSFVKDTSAAVKVWSDQERSAAGSLLAGGLGSIAAGIKPHASKGEFKFASAAVAGSSEAANAVLRSRYGMGAAQPDNSVKAVAKNTSEQVNQGRQMIAELRKLTGGLQPYELVTEL